MLIDDFLPAYDFNEIHSIEIDAPAEVVYAALFDADMGRLFIVRALMGLRSLPTLLRRGLTRAERRKLTLRDMGRSGFTLLAEDAPRELVLGIQGRFWKLRPDLCSTDAAEFNAAIPAGVARAIWNFNVQSLAPGGSRLVTETRIQCGDAASRRRFGMYWTLIQPGSGLIRRAMLSAVKAESRKRSALI